MRKRSEVDNKVNAIKDSFINNTLFVLLITFIPLIVTTLIRIPYSGITFLVIIEPVLLFTYLFIFLFRKRIHFVFKITLVLFSFFIIALDVLNTLGLLSMAVSVFLTIIVLVALYLGARSVVAICASLTIVFIIYSYLWSSGIRILETNPETYLYSISNWAAQFSGFIAMMVILAVSVTRMMKRLKEAIIAEAESSRQIKDLLKSENERLESLIEERTRDLEKTTRELMKREQLASLGELVAGVAHEINTPLGVAVTASTYLTDISKLAQGEIHKENFSKKGLIEFLEKVEETSDMINRNLYTATNLVKNFKQISVSQSNPLKGRFNLKHLIETLLFTLKHEYKNTPHTIEVDIDEKIWLNSYSNAFSQIITNLLMNSLTHAFNDGKVGEIHISGEFSENGVKIIYEDNGTGISKEILDRIYDPFFTTNRGGGGSGLGMSIVYNIVTEMLEGHIECRSAVKEGTLFTITVPPVHMDEEKRGKSL